MKHAAIMKASRVILQAVRKDLANRYDLLQDWTFFVRDMPQPPEPYYGRHLRIIPEPGGATEVTVIAPGDCNGATLAPDKWGAIEGAIFHDPYYVELSDIARAWNWTIRKTRRWGDDVFAGLMTHYGRQGAGALERVGRRRAARLYHHVIDAAGGVFWRVSRWFGVTCLIAALTLAAAQSSCSVPDHDIIDAPNDPIYQHRSFQ